MSTSLSLRKVVNGAKVLVQGRPRCLKTVRSLIRDKRGIEIGGPSAIFRNVYNLPVYDVVASLDNCDFSQNTKWAAHTAAYHFSKKKHRGIQVG